MATYKPLAKIKNGRWRYASHEQKTKMADEDAQAITKITKLLMGMNKPRAKNKNG